MDSRYAVGPSMVLATGLSFVMLFFGGGGGLVNMSYGLNSMLKNPVGGSDLY
jgi:hypothetical protein